jgi:hypothetical protein
MAAKKAQMFVATAVFLTSLLFVVQQALLTYTVLDLSRPFQTEEIYMVMNLMETINQSIKSMGDTAPEDCREFEYNLKDMISSIKDDLSKRGYILEISYNLDCSYWNNAPPQPPPLNLTMSFAGAYDYFGGMTFYHFG